MFIIVPKQRQQAPPAQSADADPTAPAEGSGTAATAQEDDRGPVRTSTACDSCRARKTKCNGQKPCGPCRRKQIICVFSRPKDRNLPVSPAQAALLQHQQRRLRTAVQQMASIIAKHENGKELDPSSVNVLEQLDRYAPAEIDDRDDSENEAVASTDTLHPDAGLPRAKPRKRPRNEDTPPSTNSSEMIDRPTAPMFDIMPNPQYNTGSRPPDSMEAYDTMMQFMQSMQSMRNRTSAPNMASAEQAPSTTHMASAPGGTALQPSTMSPEGFASAAPFQQDVPSFDFTSLIDWESSLANFQNDELFANEAWNGELAMDPEGGGAMGWR